MRRTGSFFGSTLRYLVRMLAYAGVFALAGFVIGLFSGSGSIGAIFGGVVGLIVALIVPGRTPDDGVDRARHTATARGHDAGGSGGFGGGLEAKYFAKAALY